MLLADLGNTRGKFMHLYKGKRTFIGCWDYADNPYQILQAHQGTKLIYASVTHKSVNECLERACQALNIEPFELKSSASACGVTNGYENPQQLGIDRWLALIGARALTQEACVVVDSGTALTIDVLDNSGQHLGGWIIPGLELMADSLLQRAELLNQVAQQKESALARNTAHAIGNGALAAAAGAVQQAVQLVQKNLQLVQAPSVIVTGGGAEQLQRALPYSITLVPDLIFLGMEAAQKD